MPKGWEASKSSSGSYIRAVFMRLAALRTYTFALLLSPLLGLSLAVAAPRPWTDTTGMFRVEAELVAIRNGRVVLEKADGSIITVPLEKLSAADQEYLKSLDRPLPKVDAPTPSP